MSSETESKLPLFFSVVFMGSEKYPDENAFDAFIKKHGGSDNASTDCERVCLACAYPMGGGVGGTPI